MNDKIIIRDLRVQGILGVHPHERTQTQPLLVNVVAWVDVRATAVADHIAHAVDYAKMCETIQQHIAQSQDFLVERLVTDLAQLLLKQNPPIQQIQVRLEKLEAIPDATAVGVEITRKREDLIEKTP